MVGFSGHPYHIAISTHRAVIFAIAQLSFLKVNGPGWYSLIMGWNSMAHTSVIMTWQLLHVMLRSLLSLLLPARRQWTSSTPNNTPVSFLEWKTSTFILSVIWSLKVQIYLTNILQEVPQRVYQMEVNDVTQWTEASSDRCLGLPGTKRHRQLDRWVAQTSLCVFEPKRTFSAFYLDFITQVAIHWRFNANFVNIGSRVVLLC